MQGVLGMAPGHGSKRAARRPEEDKFERKKNDAAAVRKLPQHVKLAGLKALPVEVGRKEREVALEEVLNQRCRPPFVITSNPVSGPLARQADDSAW